MNLFFQSFIALAIVYYSQCLPTYNQILSEDEPKAKLLRRDDPSARDSDYEGFGTMELKQATTDTKKRWPKGNVAFHISDKFNATEKDLIQKATRMISSVTCVKFKEYETLITNVPVVSVVKEGEGCFSPVGMQHMKYQPQKLQLTGWCFDRLGTIAHEMIHALGFEHEQNRSDRDTYVKINRDNIKPEAVQYFFPALTEKESTNFSVAYDYGSIMHYGPTGFSKNGKDTITRLKPFSGEMGQRKKLSDSDIKKIKAMYNCP